MDFTPEWAVTWFIQRGLPSSLAEQLANFLVICVVIAIPVGTAALLWPLIKATSRGIWVVIRLIFIRVLWLLRQIPFRNVTSTSGRWIREALQEVWRRIRRKPRVLRVYGQLTATGTLRVYATVIRPAGYKRVIRSAQKLIGDFFFDRER